MLKKRVLRRQKKNRFDFQKAFVKFLRLGLIAGITLLVLSQFIPAQVVIILAITIFFNASLQKFVMKNGLPADFELSTFATVLTTMGYGIKMGLLVAILSKIIASIATQYIIADHFFMMATYILAAVFASFFPGGDFVFLGLAIMVVNSIILFWMSKTFMGVDLTANLSYTGTNLIFNFIVFLLFGKIVYAVFV